MGVRLIQCLLDSLKAKSKFATNENERLGNLQRVGRNHDTFNELVWITLNEIVVLERRWL